MRVKNKPAPARTPQEGDEADNLAEWEFVSGVVAAEVVSVCSRPSARSRAKMDAEAPPCLPRLSRLRSIVGRARKCRMRSSGGKNSPNSRRGGGGECGIVLCLRSRSPLYGNGIGIAALMRMGQAHIYPRMRGASNRATCKPASPRRLGLQPIISAFGCCIFHRGSVVNEVASRCVHAEGDTSERSHA